MAQQSIPDRGPRIDDELIKSFVVAAHADLNKVKALLNQEPRLVNATWDWGGGDFETALGGAAHMGRKDIAQFLLEKGARMDLFAAAMLGELDIVQAALKAYPNVAQVPGPHGIPLIAHAKAGGAEAVVRFLESRKA